MKSVRFNGKLAVSRTFISRFQPKACSFTETITLV